MQCTYKKIDGSRCNREVISGRGLCILHEDWDHKSEEETKETFYKQIEEGIGDFEGCILPAINLDGTKIEGSLSFREAKIKGDASFKEAKIGRDAWFWGARIGEYLWFEKAKIAGYASFEKAEIGRDVSFNLVKIGEYLSFDEAKIGGTALFMEAEIGRNAWFWRARIGGDVWFKKAKIGGDASFEKAEIGGAASFDGIEATSLTFQNAIFYDMTGQENACREAKMSQERRGNRKLADVHFYREMEAKRKQKQSFIKWLESPIQYIFGYGVHPFWVIGWWLSVVFVLAFVYWLGCGVQTANSFWDNLYFSVVTAATPGYGGYRPEPGFYQILATIQAIFGTFMWATFIVTFARKFMR